MLTELGDVWSIPSAPLSVPAALGVDHFAAFPPALVRPVVLGWSPPGVCTACGQGRRPVAISQRSSNDALRPPVSLDRRLGGHHGMGSSTLGPRGVVATITGYACACGTTASCSVCICTHHAAYHPNGPCEVSGCDCGQFELLDQTRMPLRFPDEGSLPPTRPAVVLDPFGGTGTTALVASVHGRHGISVDLSADYCRLARWRTRDPGERARALDVPKPPPVPDGQASLFDLDPAS